MVEKDISKIKEHWNQEANVIREFDKIFPLGYAGTYPDYNMQHLEMNSILTYLKEGQKVLDMGCGKGYAALYFAWRKNIKILGVDYAEEMITSANKNLEEMRTNSPLQGNARFACGDVMKTETLPQEEFDVVYTERCLINITDWEKQKEAIANISKLIKTGGLFIMQEGSKTSLDNLNEIRNRYNLKPIKVVWHNLFFDDEKLLEYARQFFTLEKIDNFSSTFTLVSRALHPALVAPEEPDYKAKINKLALELPNLGDYGYQKIYVFKKK